MNDNAGNEETSNETGERHRGRSVLRTVNEDEDFIAIHNDLVGHDKDDGMEENKKNQEEPSGSESTLEYFKGDSNIPGIKSAKKKVLIIQRLRTNEEKSLHHVVKGLPMSLVNSTCGRESSTDVHNNDTDEMTRIPEITTEELQAAINTRQQRDPSRRHQSM